MRLMIVVVSCAVACGGSGSPPAAKPEPDPIAKTDAPSCATVASHLVTVIAADQPSSHAQRVPELRERCVADAWTDETRSCLGTVTNDQEVEGCASKMTDAQRSALAPAEPAADAPKPAAAAAPPPAEEKPKPGTRGPTRGRPTPSKDSSDPEEGGE